MMMTFLWVSLIQQPGRNPVQLRRTNFLINLTLYLNMNICTNINFLISVTKTNFQNLLRNTIMTRYFNSHLKLPNHTNYLQRLFTAL